MQIQTPIVQTKDLHLFYGENEALKGITLDVDCLLYTSTTMVFTGSLPPGCNPDYYRRLMGKARQANPCLLYTSRCV